MKIFYFFFSLPDETSDTDEEEEKKGETSSQKLRGSAPENSEDENEDGKSPEKSTDLDEKYKLSDYEAEEEPKSSGIEGIAVYPSEKDDPQVSEHDSDVEDEDFQIQPDDNLLVFGRVDKEDSFTLEVRGKIRPFSPSSPVPRPLSPSPPPLPQLFVKFFFLVYNHEQRAFYVHHDYMLEEPPLCIEHIRYDPGRENENETGSGNLCAVGTMEPLIQIWDLDIVEALEPVAILGPKSKKKSKSEEKKAVKKKKKFFQVFFIFFPENFFFQKIKKT